MQPCVLVIALFATQLRPASALFHESEGFRNVLVGNGKPTREREALKQIAGVLKAYDGLLGHRKKPSRKLTSHHYDHPEPGASTGSKLVAEAKAKARRSVYGVVGAPPLKSKSKKGGNLRGSTSPNNPSSPITTEESENLNEAIQKLNKRKEDYRIVLRDITDESLTETFDRWMNLACAATAKGFRDLVGFSGAPRRPLANKAPAWGFGGAS